MKQYLVTEVNTGDGCHVDKEELPPNARVLTKEMLLAANAKHGGGTPTVGLMRALDELFGERNEQD